MRVFISSWPTRFHKADCWYVKIRDYHEEDLTEVMEAHPDLLPCQRCFPDAPTMKIRRRLCPECNKDRPHPCAHNGGVKVPIRKIRGQFYESEVMAWMWEDKARRRGLVS